MNDWIKKIISQRFKKTNNNEDSWKFVNKDNEHFFFMHIPKCGGTTFRFILYNHFDEEDLWPSKKELIRLNSRYPNFKSLLEEHKSMLQKPMVMGHYSTHLFKHLSSSVQTLVFFRNPVDRSFSMLNHMYQKQDPQFKGDINKFLRDNIGQIAHVSQRIMGFSHKPMPQDQLIKKIQSFNFVGITEEYELSIKLCNKIFGWELKNIKPLNVRNNEGLEKLSASSRALLVNRLIHEIRIYNQAVIKFKTLCQLHLDINEFNI